jgi:hypothetical protein
LITAVLLLAGAAATPDWKAIEAAADSYWHQPTAENAARLWSLLPNFRPTDDQYPPYYDAAHDPFDTWEDPWSHPGAVGAKLEALVWCIEPEFLRGRSAEVRLAFRLLHFAGAAFAEDLSALLGCLATTRPDVFLSELAELQDEFPEPRLVELAGDISCDLSERQALAELRARQRALRKVTVPQYRALRDACLEDVERSIKWYQLGDKRYDVEP